MGSGLLGVVVPYPASLQAAQQVSGPAQGLVFLQKTEASPAIASTKLNPVLEHRTTSTTVRLTSAGRLGPSGAPVLPLVEMV